MRDCGGEVRLCGIGGEEVGDQDVSGVRVLERARPEILAAMASQGGRGRRVVSVSLSTNRLDPNNTLDRS